MVKKKENELCESCMMKGYCLIEPIREDLEKELTKAYETVSERRPLRLLDRLSVSLIPHCECYRPIIGSRDYQLHCKQEE